MTRCVLSALIALVGGAGTGAAAAAPMTVADYMALRGPEPTARIAYGADPSQYVELFEPRGPGPFPVVVLIHGGCFLRRFEGAPQMRGLAGALAARGVAVWNVDYRGVDQAGGGYPGTFQDMSAALDLLRARAPALRLDTARLAAVGHSAGGFLALWLAARQRLPATSPLREPHPLRVREVVVLGAAGDMTPEAPLAANCGLDPARLIGRPDPARPDPHADTTPAVLGPDGAHVVFVNGALDSIVPPAASADYARRRRATGDQAETVVLPAASHFDEVAVTSPAWPLVEAVIRKAVGERPHGHAKLQR